MRIPRIFTSQALSPNTRLELEPGASHHLLKVLRMAIGRELVLFNGNGSEFPATIKDSGKKTAVVETGNELITNRESPINTELAIGISRGDRMDWVLQKATELGVSQITPLFTERTEVKLTGDRLAKRIEQWNKIVQGACEQCQRNVVPEVSQPLKIEQYLKQADVELGFVLHHRSDANLKALPTPKSVALLIGPEGGLSNHEIQEAIKAKFQQLTIGPRVLRTETAPIAALTLIQYQWGDLG